MEKVKDKILTIAGIFLIFALPLLVILMYLELPAFLQVAIGLFILYCVILGVRYRKWLRKMDCWLQYISESPCENGELNLAIFYRCNERVVTFYGKKATRTQAKTICLPPLEVWPEIFPQWVSDKQYFILKTLPYSYNIEWTQAEPYATGNLPMEASDDGNDLSLPTNYSWKVETFGRDENLIYEEPGFRLVAYGERGGPEIDWSTGNSDFDNWTQPKGLPITEQKRQQILNSLAIWCREKEFRASISPSGSIKESH